MKLYFYRIGTSVPVLVVENVVSYSADSVVARDGTVYAPIADDCELSAKADCSEALRENWRVKNPSQEVRVAELEALMAELLFGGEAV